MKVNWVSVTAVLATLFTQAAATITLGSFPAIVYTGHNYTLSWSSTVDYVYDLWLVLEKPSEGLVQWTVVDALATALHSSSLNVSYTWTVPTNVSVLGNYALWLSGLYMTTDFSGDSDSISTDWFLILNSPSPSQTSTSSASVTSKTASATAATTSSAQRPSATATGTSSSSHSTSISGGAIAGIVIACLVILALVIGAILFTGWRKKRSAKQKREADARASRLAPVMQKGSNSFEMYGRPSPQVNKELEP